MGCFELDELEAAKGRYKTIHDLTRVVVRLYTPQKEVFHPDCPPVIGRTLAEAARAIHRLKRMAHVYCNVRLDYDWPDKKEETDAQIKT